MAARRVRGPRSRRLLGAVVLTAALISSAVVAPAPARARDAEWVAPVPGPVVAPFREPVSPYGPGHRGVDFAAAPGSPVHASNDGVVSFAGDVAGSLHVVVAHEGGIRTSYSFLLRIDVQVGQHVARGQVVGAAGGSGGGHAPGVLHFGVRVGDRYVDPMLLFRPRDLTEIVRLVPADERVSADRASTAAERAELARLVEESVGGGDCAGGVPLAEQLCDAATEGGRLVRDAVDWTSATAVAELEAGVQLLEDLGGAAADVVRANVDALRALVRELRAAASDTVRLVLEASPLGGLAAALARLGAWALEHAFACPQPDPVLNPRRSDNLVVAVGGLGSARRRRRDGSLGASFDLEWDVLGYRGRLVDYYSYSRGSPTYGPSDTYGDLHRAAQLLGEQVKALARAHPGHAVDLVGHSQGGVVIALFVMEVYRGHESEFPAIEHVTTFDSPLRGTPLARLARDAVAVLPPPVVDALEDHFPVRARSLEQLADDSDTVRRLWRASWPRQVRLLSIGALEDPFVPTPRTEAPVGRSVVVDAGLPLWPDDHDAVLHDSDALSAAQAHVAGRAPAGCGPLRGVPGEIIDAVESAAARVLEVSGGPPPPPGVVEAGAAARLTTSRST